MGIEVQVSFPLAFAAGVVSVLSACVLPLVPGYLGYVTAATLDELAMGPSDRARKAGILHSVLFMAGFGLVFLSLGLVSTAVGPTISRSLPWVQRVGGLALCAYGLRLAGSWHRATDRAATTRWGPAGVARALGSLSTGVAFGAGWTPCIGPVLGSVLLYVSLEETTVHGGALLLTYAAGLSVPFLATGVGISWPLAGSRRAVAGIVFLRRLAGGVLTALGIALVTGYFAKLTAFLAGLGQLINLEI